MPPPALMTFDAAGRETCRVRETRTNTPLQALALLNDVTFVEAARMLAERVLQAGSSRRTTGSRTAFRLASRPARRPTRSERCCVAAFERQLAELSDRTPAAAKAARSRRIAGRPRSSTRAELAASRAVVRLILNLDETVTKEMNRELPFPIERRAFPTDAPGLSGRSALGRAGRPRDAAAAEAAERTCRQPAFHAPKAKRVIYLFQSGAPSQIDLFDHKPA